MHKRPILIMAGGTGGHVFPALAVANALRARNIPVVWLGSKSGLEASVVPAHQIPIEWLTVSGMRGKNILKIGMAAVNFLTASLQAFFIMLRIKPAVVVGMGGFVSAPGGLVSQLLGRPLLIHEQNAIPGLTNRILSGFAEVVLEAFPNTFKPSVAALCTGNPIREDIAACQAPDVRLQHRTDVLRVLVLGGSLGANVLNEVLPLAIKTVPVSMRPLIWHQTGKAKHENVAKQYQDLGIDARVNEFIDDMAKAYLWADLVICRAGAMTISEISAVGIASILIPYPYAVDDHQTANATLLEALNAAILIKQPQLSREVLGDWISTLSVDRGRLMSMACNAKKLAKPNATLSVVNQCLVLAGEFDER